MVLNFTKNQMLILGLLYSNPDKSYYFREIARILDKEPGVFQYDLNNLEKRKVLKSYFQGKQRYFKLNKEYPLYKELKSIVFKTTGVEGELEDLITKFSNIKKAFLFGSFVKGGIDELSDIDLLAVGSPDIEKFSQEIKSLEKKLDREINYIIFSQNEYKEKIKTKDPFLTDILKNKIILKDAKKQKI